jgi:hypothetical protein
MAAGALPFDLVRTLERPGVEYVLVGGVGARAHGATRPIGDVDVVPRSVRDNLDRLAASLLDLGPRLRVGDMSDAVRRRRHVVGFAARSGELHWWHGWLRRSWLATPPP